MVSVLALTAVCWSGVLDAVPRSVVFDAVPGSDVFDAVHGFVVFDAVPRSIVFDVVLRFVVVNLLRPQLFARVRGAPQSLIILQASIRPSQMKLAYSHSMHFLRCSSLV